MVDELTVFAVVTLVLMLTSVKGVLAERLLSEDVNPRFRMWLKQDL